VLFTGDGAEGVVMPLRGSPLRALTLAVGLALAVVGCGSEPSQEEAEAAVCADLAEVGTAAEGVRALDAGSTLDQGQASEDALAAAVDDLRVSVAEVPRRRCVGHRIGRPGDLRRDRRRLRRRHTRRCGSSRRRLDERARRRVRRDEQRAGLWAPAPEPLSSLATTALPRATS
jgi:hypothetical protein